jgi:predicted nuclease of predicted toxin-antitoxin system
VRLLFDENISQRLVALLENEFPESRHIEDVVDRGSTDTGIWEVAKALKLVVASKDNDFRQRALLLGPPPKVIWLDLGKARTAAVAKLLRSNVERIRAFSAVEDEGLLVLELS